MKITKVDIYMLDATAQRARRRPICCRVWTDDGFYGDGEAGIAFDYAAPAGIGMLQDISRLIIGKDPMRTDELWERMFKISFWGQGGGPVVFAAISAIDIALMDIKGKVLNVPMSCSAARSTTASAAMLPSCSSAGTRTLAPEAPPRNTLTSANTPCPRATTP